MRTELVRRYGKNASALLDRLGKLAAGRNAKVALDAIELLLAYHSGKPVQAVDLEADVHTSPLRIVIDGDGSAAPASDAGAGVS